MSILSDIDDRSREIFTRIVEDYLETGMPVGSRSLTQNSLKPQQNRLSISPATIRNIMADLTDLGLLYAPHISAGRLPTEMGLRLFVDGMMEIGNWRGEERQHIEEALRQQSTQTQNPQSSILEYAASQLSGLTGAASLVMAQKKDTPIKHIEFVPIGKDMEGNAQALVVMVSQQGDVENRIIKLPAGLPISALHQASNFINHALQHQWQGQSLTQVLNSISIQIESKQSQLDQLTSALVQQGVVAITDNKSFGGGQSLIIRGSSNLLNDENTQDLDRIRMLFDDLEQQRDVIDLLQGASDGEGVRIFIGAENKLFSLSGSSLIIAPYKDEEHQTIGVLGVIGPTRLNYAKIIPMVDTTAHVVSKLIK